MKSRKVAAKKPKQLSEVNMKTLSLLAKAEGHTKHKDVAVWIISVSGYWRLKGYDEIMKELKNA